MSITYAINKPPLSRPTLSIIVPTYNERSNIRPLVETVANCMGHTPWELIFVDDDSADGTRHEIAALVQEGAPVRCLRRGGGRAFGSAVVGSAVRGNAENNSVFGANRKEDASMLPPMLRAAQK